MLVLSFDVGVKNLAMVLLQLTGDSRIKVLLMRSVSMAKAEKSTTTEEVANVCAYLEENAACVCSCDAVAIESQMGDNVKMKVISHAIQACILMLCKRPPEGVPLPVTLQPRSIKFCSPSNKLKVFKDLDLSAHRLPENPYRRKKRMAILHAREALKDDEPMLAIFEAHDKKDDLADAILQGMFYIRSVEQKTRSGGPKNKGKQQRGAGDGTRQKPENQTLEQAYNLASAKLRKIECGDGATDERVGGIRGGGEEGCAGGGRCDVPFERVEGRDVGNGDTSSPECGAVA